MNLKPFALAGAALIGLATTSAHAAFDGAYDASHWTTSGTGNGTAVISSDASTLTLTSADFTPDDSPGATRLDYAITLASATTITFDWSYVSDDTSSSSDPFGYAINGVATQLSLDDQPGFIEQDGSVTLTLNKGDVFSFEASSIDSIFGASTATVTGFNAISAVPEPTSAALLLAGLVAAAAARRRQRR